MFPILLSVFVISISGVMQPGIVTAMTIAKSFKSPWTGPLVALGHAVIEVPLILLVYFGFTQFFQKTSVQLALSIAGGGMFIFLGIVIFRARTRITQEGKDLPYSAFTAGILTSILNPFFWLWWATIGSMLVMKLENFGVTGLLSFVLAHWLCDLVWLSIISFFVYYTQRLWGRQATRVQEAVFIICSLLLVGFGGWYLVSGIQLVV
jgi:threonine/homoserine/homoserine lactone efflux protein